MKKGGNFILIVFEKLAQENVTVEQWIPRALTDADLTTILTRKPVPTHSTFTYISS